MMSMRMELQISEEEFRRLARIAVYRLRRGEQVTIAAWDPILPYVLEILDAPIATGAASGSYP